MENGVRIAAISDNKRNEVTVIFSFLAREVLFVAGLGHKFMRNHGRGLPLNPPTVGGENILNISNAIFV
jgi:hypothetical protein